MKILFVLEYYPPHVGGGELLFERLARGLVARGHDCSVLTCRLAGAPDREEAGGVRVRRVGPVGRGDRYAFTLAALPTARSLAREADVVHTMTYNGAFPAWAAARATGRPSVLTVHEVVGPRWPLAVENRAKAAVLARLENLILALPFSAWAVNSQSALSDLAARGVPKSRIHFAYPGVDTDLFNPGAQDHRGRVRQELGIPESAFLVLYFGRPGAVKGVETLIRAAPGVARAVPNARMLLILAQDPKTGRARAEALAAVHPGLVRILDPVPRERLAQIVGAADCVAVPSINEGFGFSLAEACAVGVPVAASDAGSIPEVVSGPHALARPNDPADLARAIADVHQGRVSRAPAREFSWDAYVQSHEKLYARLAGGKMGA
ncbi:MAG: glycosyltransferase family 4 protein [Proteobacteria bacterium]|nr:glycosyltransferase family 4 protein [Pseudomonadota bacterium]